MPSSAVRSFARPDEYAAAMRATETELTVTARGQFAGHLTRIDLHHLWIQRFDDNLPRVGRFAINHGRAIFSLWSHPGAGLLSDGVEVPPSVIMRRTEGEVFFQRSLGPARWASMSLPLERMASIGAALSGCDLTPPRRTMRVTPPPPAMSRLRRLHATAGDLAKSAPEIIEHAEAAHGLEQTLIDALVACVGPGSREQDSSARRRHGAIMRRFHAAVEEHPEEPLYIPELCANIGTSHRTLHACCEESSRDRAQAIPSASAHEFGEEGPAKGRCSDDDRYVHRCGFRFLEFWSVRRGIQSPVRRATLNHAAQRTGVVVRTAAYL